MSRHILGLAALAVAAPALAQQQGAALGGNPITGLCMLSQPAVLANSKVGQAATARLKVLAEQAQAEVEGERRAIEAEAKALDAKRASLKPADLQAQDQALRVRLQGLQQKAQIRAREIELTREKALGQIQNQEGAVIAAAYKARNCGLLIDRNSVLGGNLSYDISAQVVQGLDAKIQTITFNREVLPAR